MVANFLKRLTKTRSARPDLADQKIALAALLVRCARVDGEYAGAELETIDAVLAQQFSLSAEAALELRNSGEALEADVGDTVRLTKAIKDTVPYEDRTMVAEALWRVVLADEVRDADENAFLRLVVRLIGVNDVDSGIARQRAAGG